MNPEFGFMFSNVYRDVPTRQNFQLNELRQGIGKNQNTFAKMQREKEKKRKADEKRLRRLERKRMDANVASVGRGDNELEPVETGEPANVEDESPNESIKSDD